MEIVPGGFFWAVFHEVELGFWFALKLDWADFFEHFSLHRKSGLVKYIRFTPDDSRRFVAVCQGIINSNP